MNNLTAVDNIETKILIIRGKKVLLDRDLAVLYGVETRSLNQAVKRNIDRFPDDFMFPITENEARILVSQFVIPSKQHLGGYLPYAFTEQGVAMLSSVLKSERAIKVNIMIMRAFVKIREIVSTHIELADKISEIERRLDYHDETLIDLIEAVKKLLPMSGHPEKGRIGFQA